METRKQAWERPQMSVHLFSSQRLFCLFLTVLTVVALLNRIEAQNVEPETLKRDFESIINAHSKALRSATCSGNLTIQIREQNEGELATIVDCNFKLALDADKVRLERDYVTNKLTKKHQPGSWGIESEGFVRGVLISKGDENYWARFDAKGVPTCYFLNRDWCDSLFKNIDCPIPTRVMEETIKPILYKSLNWQLKPLNGDGLMVTGNGPYSVECFFLPPKPLRLARVVYKVGGMTSLEYNLQWAESNGVGYVKRFTMQTREIRRVIEYSDFKANEAIAPELFTLQSLGVDTGTEFTRNAPEPRKFELVGDKLVPK